LWILILVVAAVQQVTELRELLSISENRAVQLSQEVTVLNAQQHKDAQCNQWLRGQLRACKASLEERMELLDGLATVRRLAHKHE
jgi:hypothetical protein